MTVNRKTTPANAAREWLLSHASHDGDDCLIWPFFRDPYYGRGRIGAIDDRGAVLWAHRIMCELAHGEPPTPKHQAAHNCGNGVGGCVNPRHLEWKTNSENQLDRRKHGTHGGAIGTRTRLTAEQIADIRSCGGTETQIETATRLGVKRGTVEYWRRHNREPLPPGSSPSAVRARASKGS